MAVLPFRKPNFPRQDLNIVWYLIAVNALVFFLSALTKGSIVLWLSMIPLRVIGLGHIWTPLTYAFLHMDPMHLIFNMIALFFIGTAIETEMGSIQFLLFYLGAALASGILSLGAFLVAGNVMTPLLGASGAVYGIMVAFACLFPWRQLFIFGILPVRAPYLVLGYAIIDIVMEFSGRSTGVAHLTHLFGLLYGIVVMAVVYRINYFSTLFKQ